VPVTLDGTCLTVEDVVQVARRNQPVKISNRAWKGVNASRKVVDKLVSDGTVAYGITTGFGEFAHVTIQRA
jgi:histidine ammonia-lyase